MSFKNYAFYDKIILGKPRAIKGFTYIPIVSTTIEGCGNFGIFLWGSLTPKALIVADSSGEISFYPISRDATPSKLLESIALSLDKE